MFSPIDSSLSFPERELGVLSFWKERQIYQKSLAAREGAEPFVFYEGPPTANGLPHPGHCLTRTIKDLYPRYKTMRGYRCERKAGWDTHGLPVEVEVCKELGIHSKEEIESYGIEPFIQLCQKSVWRYVQEWERLTERIGFWVNLEDAYVTYHQSYVESVWWSLKQLFDRGLLYQGHKIVWWWAQGGTALSSGEVGQGYREVADPSVFVKFPLLDGESDASLIVWTTTPWTLPSNQFAAVHPEIQYATAIDPETGERLIAAATLIEALGNKVKRELEIVDSKLGSELVGLRYRPPFDCYFDEDQPGAWRVVAADFVTTESGSGVVHQAPAFGEVDFDVLEQQRGQLDDGETLPLINCVAPDGKFTDEGPAYCRGRWVKECDREITRDLKQRGLLFHQEQYLHDYPFCWRAEEDPLIQYPRESWFIRTTSFKEQMLANNQAVNWLPEHIKGGRMGKFLESNVDWALSRERFWGTPLPIWVCEETGQMEAVASYAELLEKPGIAGTEAWEKAQAKNPELPVDLCVHKPYIDEVTYDSPFAESARMRRVSEVIDCWYDSGAMPFAQWGYCGEERGGGGDNPLAARFQEQFPADFISEALDQTRGWFYSQLAISTMLWGPDADDDSAAQHEFPHPFRNCIVLGLMLGEDGQKMSKSKRNYREPREIFDKYGADAMRWYLLANQPPWTSIRYSEQAIKESVPEFLLRLWNVYSFFTIYANIDGFDPTTAGVQSAADFAGAAGHRPPRERGELDRWILSELHRTAARVVERMDAYDNYAACESLSAFVDGLSNWYVRRSRDRFWSSDKQSPEKLDAYWTLYECLLTAARMIAPFTPFLAEELWQKLVAEPLGQRAVESVHLCDFPEGNAASMDETLSARMELVRLIASLGRNARTSAGLKVRQPLSKVEVILADRTHEPWLAEHAGVIADELNIKQVEFSDRPEEYVHYDVLPNFKLLGPKLGKAMPAVKKALAGADGAALLAALKSDGKISLAVAGQEVELGEDEIEVRIKAKPGWTAAADRGVVVVLSTELTDDLLIEGCARGLIRAIQEQRKEAGCEFTDRIRVGVETETAQVRSAVAQFGDLIQRETLAVDLRLGPLEGVTACESKSDGSTVKLYVQPTEQA